MAAAQLLGAEPDCQSLLLKRVEIYDVRWGSKKDREYFPQGLINSAKDKLEEVFMYVLTSLLADGSPSPVSWRDVPYRYRISMVVQRGGACLSFCSDLGQ